MARRYLINKILPARQVHLIGGPSGIGKTRWIVYLLKDWLKSRRVLGFDSHPEPVMYLATDRNEESLEDTFAPFHINGDFKWKSLLNSKDSIKDVIESNPDIRLFIFDPIMLFVPGYKYIDYGCVAGFLRHLTELCTKFDVTILGVVHTAKVKQGEEFMNPRERLLGSAAWGAYAETLFVLGADSFTSQENDQTRHVYVLPRNAPEFKTFWKFNELGIPETVSEPKPKEDLYDLFLEQIPNDIPCTCVQLQKLAYEIGISRATFFRYLRLSIERYDIEKVKHGYYLKVPPPTIQ